MLRLVKLKTPKTYIIINLAEEFIKLSKLLINTLILFVHKRNKISALILIT